MFLNNQVRTTSIVFWIFSIKITRKKRGTTTTTKKKKKKKKTKKKSAHTISFFHYFERERERVLAKKATKGDDFDAFESRDFGDDDDDPEEVEEEDAWKRRRKER